MVYWDQTGEGWPEIKNLALCPDFVNKYFIRVIFIVELIIQLSSLSHLKFVCLHFKLIVSQSFILVVKNLSQVRMFSRKLPTIYSRTVNCPQNWKDFICWYYFFGCVKKTISGFFVHLIDKNKTELLREYPNVGNGTTWHFITGPIK